MEQSIDDTLLEAFRKKEIKLIREGGERVSVTRVVTKSVQDNIPEDYQLNGILDALASLFSVYTPCAAVARESKDNGSKYVLSYNDSKFQSFGKFQVAKVFIPTLVKYIRSNDKEMLTLLYIVWNSNFKSTLSRMHLNALTESNAMLKSKFEEFAIEVQEANTLYRKYSGSVMNIQKYVMGIQHDWVIKQKMYKERPL